jgi:putative hydrolase of the HAD superfamily
MLRDAAMQPHPERGLSLNALPRAILFDLDDTLIRAYARPELVWPRVTAEFAAELAPLAPLEVAAAIQANAGAFWADPERHRHWRQRLAASRREIVNRTFATLERAGAPLARELADRIADRFSGLREAELCLHAGACETLDALRARGVLLGLLTNGAAETQRSKLARFELAPRFDHVQIEGEHGFGKPEERAYRHALSALGVSASDSWIVGDNLEWEVAAPQRLGIHAIWFDGEGQGLPANSAVQPDRIVCALRELLE